MVGWLALFGAVVYLDTTAAFQFMICQPIIACPIYGVIAGRPEIGLFFGLTFQLLWLRSLPVGAARFPEGNLGALIATALAAAIPPTPDRGVAWLVLGVACVAGVLAASFGRNLTPVVRYLMRHLASQYESALFEGKRKRACAVFIGALLLNAIAGVVFTLGLYFVFLKVIESLLGVSTQVPLPAELALSTDRLWMGLFPALFGAGVGIVAARFARRRHLGWIVGGFGMAMGALLWL